MVLTTQIWGWVYFYVTFPLTKRENKITKKTNGAYSPDPGQKCTAISRKVFIKSARNKPERYKFAGL